jgi:lysyl-tRNA synthetase class 1
MCRTRRCSPTHLGKPLSRIPDPFDKFESFAAHNNAMLREFLDQFGFEYEFISSSSANMKAVRV